MSEPGGAALELFSELAELNDDEREERLRALTEEDEELARLVARMLDEDRRAQPLLDSRAALALAAEKAAAPGLPSGRRVGPYRVVRELGRGGMGVVYLAQRDAPRMQVALKVVRGWLAAPEHLDRFVREQVALARLEHPSIARFIDAGGLPDGTPYYAMEYVDGDRLTAHCDRHRLTVDQRLELFRIVCDAVDHAHRNLIVHRDLKPTNILVDADGRPRLVDFGIAKLLDPAATEAPLTREGGAPLTPAYAAPEQLRGEPATVATDVFALGGVLHELLCGSRPAHESDAPPKRPSSLIAEMDPERVAERRSTTPLRLRRRLRGDLDNIVLEALEPDPERRYASVAALRDDLDRHRQARPVSARPPTVRYRAGRFLRRHRFGVAVAAAMAAVILVAGAALVLQQRQTAQERDRARVAAARAERVSAFLTELFEASDPFEGIGRETAVGVLLDRGTERVDELEDAPAVQAGMLAVLAQVWTQLGEYDRAEPLWRRSLDLLDPTEEAAVERATRLIGLAEVLSQREGAEEAAPLYRQALDALGGGPASEQRSRALIRTLLADAGNEFRRGRFTESAARYRGALDALRAGTTPDPDLEGTALSGIGITHLALGRPREAERSLGEAAAVLARIGPRGRARLARVHNNRANAMVELGRVEEAVELQRRALELKRQVYPPGHPTIGVTMTNLANALSSLGRTGESEPLLAAALELQTAALGREHRYVVNVLDAQGRAARDGGDLERADDLYRRAVESYRPVLDPLDRRFARLLLGWGEVLLELERWGEAEVVLRDLLRVREAHERRPWRIAQAQRLLATALVGAGRLDAAERLLRAAESALSVTEPGNAAELRATRVALDQVATARETGGR